MSEKVEIKLFKPFGPPIGKFEMKNDLVKEINNYIDEVYESIENFCVVTVQAYYCEKLEESIANF